MEGPIEIAPGVHRLGSSLVNLNVVTGSRGPQTMPKAMNEDYEQARSSLSRLDGVDADLVLPGHGEPYRGRPADAVAEALGLALA